MASLERRVEHLERNAQEDRHTVAAGQGAHSHALSLVHTELAEFREETGQRLDAVEGQLGEIKSTLAEILGRLPERPAQA
jgi:hypothetical protein